MSLICIRSCRRFGVQLYAIILSTVGHSIFYYLNSIPITFYYNHTHIISLRGSFHNLPLIRREISIGEIGKMFMGVTNQMYVSSM